jgi:hypothetical protein
MNEPVRPDDWVRLGCNDCDRDDCDGITEARLDELRATWEGIAEMQSYEEAIAEIEPNDPRSERILDWETHCGVCPECQEARDAE